jgi:hypothetical protein
MDKLDLLVFSFALLLRLHASQSILAYFSNSGPLSLESARGKPDGHTGTRQQQLVISSHVLCTPDSLCRA